MRIITGPASRFASAGPTIPVCQGCSRLIAGVPDAIIQKVNADLRKVVALKEVQDQLHVLGTYTRDLTPAQTTDFIRSEEQLWWPIVRQVNEQK